jgi:hypothetical protein
LILAMALARSTAGSRSPFAAASTIAKATNRVCWRRRRSQ